MKLQALVSDLLADGLPVEAPVYGSSMWPALYNGQLVVLSPWDGIAAALPGKIIAYKSSGSIVIVHRVLRVDECFAYCRGDAIKNEDEPVAYERILGIIQKTAENPIKVLLRYSRQTIYFIKRALSRTFKRRHSGRH